VAVTSVTATPRGTARCGLARYGAGQKPAGQIGQLAPAHARSVGSGHISGAGGVIGGPTAGVAAVTLISSSKK
jgi:hypothetical protein